MGSGVAVTAMTAGQRNSDSDGQGGSASDGRLIPPQGSYWDIDLLTPGVVCALLKVKKSWFYDAVEEGALEASDWASSSLCPRPLSRRQSKQRTHGPRRPRRRSARLAPEKVVEGDRPPDQQSGWALSREEHRDYLPSSPQSVVADPKCLQGQDSTSLHWP
jgi:hypothetical protein